LGFQKTPKVFSIKKKIHTLDIGSKPNFSTMTDTFEPECIYHIYNRAIGEEKLFRTKENYFYFLAKYQHYLDDKFITLAYCLIPNHFHFLVKIKPNITNEQAVKAFSDFQNAYCKSFNKVFNRSGSLFHRKFKRKKIDNEAYWTKIVIYIHQNPVKHKIAKSPDEWMFSSFKGYLSDKPSKVDRKMVLEWFGGMDGFGISHQANTDTYLPEEFLLE
jgi:putative transposase